MKKLFIIAILLLSTNVFAETKAELLARAEAKFDVVGTPFLAADSINGYPIRWYQVQIFELQKDSAAVSQTLQFYVKNEGDSTEAAFFMKQTPDAPEEPFVVAIKSYLVGEQIILKQLLNFDKSARWAECLVWEFSTPNFIEKKVLVRKPASVFVHNDIQ